MKKLITLFLIFHTSASNFCKQPKIVGLVPIRNEQIIIAQCLKTLSLYTDAIIVLDDCSTDNTVKIVESLAQKYNVERIIKKEFWYRDEPGDKNKLLQAAREIGGTHFIFMDADEMFTANCMNNNFLHNRILALKPGEKLAMNWIALWQSCKKYRFDKSVWTWNYRPCIFHDDGKCFYQSDFIHTHQIPQNLNGKMYQIEGYTYGILHFQFVNWRNLLIKQAWYRCLERIRYPNKSISVINKRYAPSKDEKNIHLENSPSYWFDGYDFFDSSIFDQPEIWREKQVLEWFNKQGKDYFSGLDIWDIDWVSGLK